MKLAEANFPHQDPVVRRCICGRPIYNVGKDEEGYIYESKCSSCVSSLFAKRPKPTRAEKKLLKTVNSMCKACRHKKATKGDVCGPCFKFRASFSRWAAAQSQEAN